MRSISDIFTKTYRVEDGLCFVAMPFSEELNEIYERVIRPAVSAEPLLMRCVRGDEVYTDKPIMGDIWGLIQRAEIVVADLTGKNPNVLYELGLCHSLWKRVVMIAQSTDDLPFDLRHFRAITYKHTLNGADKLKDDLVNAITELRALPSAPSDTLSLRDNVDSLKEFSGMRVITKESTSSPTQAVIKRAHTTQIKYPDITITVSISSVNEDAETVINIGFILTNTRSPKSLTTRLYPSQHLTVTGDSVEVFYLTLYAVDIEQKSALVEIVPLIESRENK